MTYEVRVEFRKDYIRVDGNTIFVGVTSRPQGGKANIEMVKKIARYFKVCPSHVRILAGHKSRKKIVQLPM